MGAAPPEGVEGGLQGAMMLDSGADLACPVEARRQGAGAAQAAFHHPQVEGEGGVASVGREVDCGEEP